MVKLNLLMVALVLLTAVSLFVSSERSFQKAVFDPCTKKLLQAESGTKALEPYFPSFLHYLGTEELNAAVVQIYAQMGLSPSQTLHATNEWLRTSNKTSMFFTVWFGILDLSTGVITAVNSFIGGAKQFDDLTMLCLEYRGPRANPEAEGDAP